MGVLERDAVTTMSAAGEAAADAEVAAAEVDVRRSEAIQATQVAQSTVTRAEVLHYQARAKEDEARRIAEQAAVVRKEANNLEMIANARQAALQQAERAALKKSEAAAKSKVLAEKAAAALAALANGCDEDTDVDAASEASDAES